MLSRATSTSPSPVASLTSGLAPVIVQESSSLPSVVAAAPPKPQRSEYARALYDFAFLSLPVPATAVLFAGVAAACGMDRGPDLLVTMMFSLPVGLLGSHLLAKCLGRARADQQTQAGVAAPAVTPPRTE